MKAATGQTVAHVPDMLHIHLTQVADVFVAQPVLRLYPLPHAECAVLRAIGHGVAMQTSTGQATVAVQVMNRIALMQTVYANADEQAPPEREAAKHQFHHRAECAES